MNADSSHKTHRRRKRQRGGVLLLALVLSSALAVLATSFDLTVRAQVDVARSNRTSLGAELAAHSGLEYAMRRIALDPNWEGSGDDPIPSGYGAFFVERQSNDPLHPELVILIVEGTLGDSRYRVAADVDISTLDPMRTSALATLGGLAKVHGSDIEGDLLVVDEIGHIWDWDNTLNGGAGGWKPGGPDEIDQFQYSGTEVTGTLYKYTDEVYGDGVEVEISQDVYMPSWNLDPYLIPASDRVIFDRPKNLKNLDLEETVVVILDPGEMLTIQNCNLRGGLVVWCESDYDLRSGPRNAVNLMSHNTIGGGDQGAHPHIGLLGPAVDFRGQGGQGKEIRGFTFVNELFTSVHMDMIGMTVVVNDLKNLNGAELVFDPAVADDLPGGIAFGGSPIRHVSLARIHEDFTDSLTNGLE